MSPLYFIKMQRLLLLYLSLPQQASDLHSVQVPARVHAAVVVADADLLDHVSHICQLCTTEEEEEDISGQTVPAEVSMQPPCNCRCTSTMNMSSAPRSKYILLSLLLTHRDFCCVHAALRPYSTMKTSASVPAPKTSLVKTLIS